MPSWLALEEKWANLFRWFGCQVMCKSMVYGMGSFLDLTHAPTNVLEHISSNGCLSSCYKTNLPWSDVPSWLALEEKWANWFQGLGRWVMCKSTVDSIESFLDLTRVSIKVLEHLQSNGCPSSHYNTALPWSGAPSWLSLAKKWANWFRWLGRRAMCKSIGNSIVSFSHLTNAPTRVWNTSKAMVVPSHTTALLLPLSCVPPWLALQEKWANWFRWVGCRVMCKSMVYNMGSFSHLHQAHTKVMEHIRSNGYRSSRYNTTFDRIGCAF